MIDPLTAYPMQTAWKGALRLMPWPHWLDDRRAIGRYADALALSCELCAFAKNQAKFAAGLCRLILDGDRSAQAHSQRLVLHQVCMPLVGLTQWSYHRFTYGYPA